MSLTTLFCLVVAVTGLLAVCGAARSTARWVVALVLVVLAVVGLIG